MKHLQNYIEEEVESFNQEFGIHFKDSSGELQFANEFLRESLHRIAKITAEEIVPEKKEKTKFQNDMYDALDDGYNQALSDLQTKIKEFGI